MLTGFKNFIMRGNVVELAVAVVIGAAFSAVVDKIVKAVINPLISAVFKADQLDSALVVELPGGSQLLFGAVIGAILNFIIVAAVVYFAIVLPMNKVAEKAAQRRGAGEEENDKLSPEEAQEQLLREIRDLLASKQ
ncbi:MAG: large conductance mechanosensitive channel protein MscL [Microbacteriaceae bacterium]|nr:large conductance mechanosensitive channel protein MscL [Microbacteriaceae bacterium]